MRNPFFKYLRTFFIGSIVYTKILFVGSMVYTVVYVYELYSQDRLYFAWVGIRLNSCYSHYKEFQQRQCQKQDHHPSHTTRTLRPHCSSLQLRLTLLRYKYHCRHSIGHQIYRLDSLEPIVSTLLL